MRNAPILSVLKTISATSIIVLVFGIGIVFTSCQDNDVIAIIVNTPPLDSEYELNEPLNLSGMVISIFRENGDIEDVPFNEFESAGISSNPINGAIVTESTDEVLFTHNPSGKTTSYILFIIKVDSVVISSKPFKLSYYINQRLDLSGLEITLIKNNGDQKIVAKSAFQANKIVCSPEENSVMTENNESVTITDLQSGHYASLALEVISSINDIEGNEYSVSAIGNQVWLTENLRTTKYKDGNQITLITNDTDWSNQYGGSYCWYNDNPSNKSTYGALYNWYTVAPQNLCPTGWHVPNNSEWSTLIDFLGGVNIAGGKMKVEGTEFWASPNVGATNEVGFNARPGGYRGAFVGQFDEEKIRGWWWSSSDGVEYGGTAFVNLVNNDKTSVLVGEANERNGVYVRCVKDTEQ